MSSAAKIFDSFLVRGYLEQLFFDVIKENAAVGRDGVKVEAFETCLDEEIEIAIRKIKCQTYDFTPYKEKLISKGAKSHPRQISIPTVRDKLVLKFVSEVLARLYPEHVSRPPHQYIKQIHSASSNALSNASYLRLDIQSYYPSINHSIMMRILRRKIRKKPLLCLIEKAIQTPTGVGKSSGIRSTQGLPQGLSISNILSSIYLEDIDRMFSNLDEIGYWRFVDDILLLGPQPSIEYLSRQLPKEVKRKRKLSIHKLGAVGGKSLLVPCNVGVDYLGYKFCKELIEIRDSSIKKMFANLMNLITAMKYRDNKASLIWRLNLRITGCKYNDQRIGWLFFFSQTRNMRQIMRLDSFISNQLQNVLSEVQMKQIKRLIKSIHEIKYNYRDTKYIPDFDDFNDEQMRAQIKILLPHKKNSELDSLQEKELRKLFNRCISREISNLEKDMLEVFS